MYPGRNLRSGKWQRLFSLDLLSSLGVPAISMLDAMNISVQMSEQLQCFRTGFCPLSFLVPMTAINGYSGKSGKECRICPVSTLRVTDYVQIRLFPDLWFVQQNSVNLSSKYLHCSYLWILCMWLWCPCQSADWQCLHSVGVSVYSVCMCVGWHAQFHYQPDLGTGNHSSPVSGKLGKDKSLGYWTLSNLTPLDWEREFPWVLEWILSSFP